MCSEYREQDLKTHLVSIERVSDYRGCGLESFN